MNRNQTKISRDVLNTLEEKASRVDILLPVLEEAMSSAMTAVPVLIRGKELDEMLRRIVRETVAARVVTTGPEWLNADPPWLTDAEALLEKPLESVPEIVERFEEAP